MRVTIEQFAQLELGTRWSRAASHDGRLSLLTTDAATPPGAVVR